MIIVIHVLTPKNTPKEIGIGLPPLRPLNSKIPTTTKMCFFWLSPLSRWWEVMGDQWGPWEFSRWLVVVS